MRRVTPQVYYTFTPSTKLVSVPGYIAQQRLLLITDVTNNVVLYNFSDPNLTATFAYNQATTPVTTDITLAYNTSGGGFSSTDQLQILVDEQFDYVAPAEVQTDPVGKSRVSEPQALIDTDFEYGLQPTKWETLALTNNKPSFFVNYNNPLPINDINATNGSSTFTVNVGFTLGSGTIATSGNAVTGTSTLFTQQLQVGFYIFTSGFLPIGSIAVINSDTSATMSASALNAGGGAAYNYINQQLPVTGQPLLIQDTNFAGAQGSFVIQSVNQTGSNGLVCTSRYAYTGTTGSIYNPSASTVFPGTLYTGAQYTLNSSISNITFSGNTATFSMAESHGLQVGNGVLVSNSNVSTFNGSWTVTGYTSETSFQVALSATPATGSNRANVIARPDVVFSHRAFDGGVFFTTGNPVAHNAAVVRQTRRYFRYQSGKGIQVSTGTIVKPAIPVNTITANTTGVGAVINIKTKNPHYFSTGANVYISNSAISTGVNGITTGYAGNYMVQQTPDAYTMNVFAQTTLASTTCVGLPQVGPNNWYGSKVRMGLFDSQNGLYWEFDGQTLFAVRRGSTDQITGFVSVTQNSSTVTSASIAAGGQATNFSTQLVPYDYIVIRGQTYRVLQINSNTSMTITPPYRGASISQCQVSKVQDFKIPQNQFNIDRLDGTGPSGYVIDLTKIQMWYVDYSWYGAGYVRWGVRAVSGDIIYAHKLQHNNVQYTSYMRSGNLPGHYEVNNEVPETQLTSTFAASATTLNVGNTSTFPTQGILLIKSSTPEYVSYDSTTATTFNVITRGQTAGSLASVTTVIGNCNVTTTTSASTVQAGMYVTGTGIPDNTYVTKITYGSPNTLTLNQAPTAGGSITLTALAMANANQTHTFSSTNPIGIQQHAPFFTPQIAHWGTSVIMDGRFDNDKSFVFIAGMVGALSVGQNQRAALMSIRIGPAADGGRTATLGNREIVNHMQLTPFQADLASNGLFLIQLILNGVTSGTSSYQGVGGSSLAQVAYHPVGTTIIGGEPIFAFYAATAGGAAYAVTQQDITIVRDLGNSILGGGQTNTAGQQVYPDGPDVLTFVAQNIDTSSKNIQARISWTEAQA